MKFCALFAERAKQAMDGYMLFDKPIRVEDVRESGQLSNVKAMQSNVFITVRSFDTASLYLGVGNSIIFIGREFLRCQDALRAQNLPHTVSHDSLDGLLSPFGKIFSIKLPTPSKESSKGMAYVQFSNQEAAAAAIQASKDKALRLDGATVVVAPYLTYQQRIKSQEESFTNLYVKNLPSNVLTNEDLSHMFSPYGNITSARLVKVG